MKEGRLGRGSVRGGKGEGGMSKKTSIAISLVRGKNRRRGAEGFPVKDKNPMNPKMKNCFEI